MRTKGKGKGKGKHIIDQVIHVYRKRLAESAGLVSPAVAADENGRRLPYTYMWKFPVTGPSGYLALFFLVVINVDAPRTESRAAELLPAATPRAAATHRLSPEHPNPGLVSRSLTFWEEKQCGLDHRRGLCRGRPDYTGGGTVVCPWLGARDVRGASL